VAFNDIERKRIEHDLATFMTHHRPPPHIRPETRFWLSHLGTQRRNFRDSAAVAESEGENGTCGRKSDLCANAECLARVLDA